MIKKKYKNDELMNNLRSTNASYVMYWHALTISSTITLLGLEFAIAGFALSKTTLEKEMLALLILLIGGVSIAGFRLATIFSIKVALHQEILAKLDHIQRLFNDDLYLKSKSIYPKEWMHSGDTPLIEPVARFCRISYLLTPGVLAIILLLSKESLHYVMKSYLHSL